MVNDEVDFAALQKEDMVDAATYHVRIGKVTVRGPKPGKEFGSVTFHLVIQEPEELIGRMVFDNITLEPGKRYRVRQLFEAAGFDMTSGGAKYSELQDAEVLAVVTQDLGGLGADGNTYPARNRVQRYMAIV